MTDENAFEQMAEATARSSPQARALSLEIVGAGVGDRGPLLRLPYDTALIGDPDTGVIAGGAVTTLLDHACGQACGRAVFAATGRLTSLATLDLRIDYMRAAKPGLAIMAQAHCYKLTRSIAFVRAQAWDESADDPVAAAQAAFMLDSHGGREAGANLAPPLRRPAS